MFSPYRGRSHTKKQNHPCKQAITPTERKIRAEKKRLAKLFSKLKFSLKNKITSAADSPPAERRFSSGPYKSIYQHFQSPLFKRRGAGGEARNS